MMNATLKIYTMSHCPGFSDTLQVRREIARRFPNISIELVDLDDAGFVVPPEVFSIPTYVLNGDVVSLGNPYVEHLERWIRCTLDQ